MIQPPSSLPPTKKGSFVGTVTNQGFPFQPDVLYKSNSVVGTIKATQCHIFLLKKGKIRICRASGEIFHIFYFDSRSK